MPNKRIEMKHQTSLVGAHRHGRAGDFPTPFQGVSRSVGLVLPRSTRSSHGLWINGRSVVQKDRDETNIDNYLCGSGEVSTGAKSLPCAGLKQISLDVHYPKNG